MKAENQSLSVIRDSLGYIARKLKEITTNIYFVRGQEIYKFHEYTRKINEAIQKIRENAENVNYSKIGIIVPLLEK